MSWSGLRNVQNVPNFHAYSCALTMNFEISLLVENTPFCDRVSPRSKEKVKALKETFLIKLEISNIENCWILTWWYAGTNGSLGHPLPCPRQHLQRDHNQLSKRWFQIYRVSQKKLSFTKLSIWRSCCQLGRNTYGIRGKSANAQFGKTQFF